MPVIANGELTFVKKVAKRADGRIIIASEGLILVSSSTEQMAAGGGQTAGIGQDDIVKTSLLPLKRNAEAKEETHVSQALRTVYQRAVDEDIPSEMLDLLNRLG